MNVLIIDTDKVNLDVANQIYKNIVEQSGSDDWVAIPKGFDVMMDISVDWIKMIRDKMDEKIKEIEGIRGDED